MDPIQNNTNISPESDNSNTPPITSQLSPKKKKANWLKAGVRRITKILLAIVGVYFALFSIAFIILNFPEVQNQLVPFINQKLSQALQTTVRVRKIHLALFDKIELTDVYIADLRKQPMITVKTLKISVIATPTLALFTAPEKIKHFYARTVELNDVYFNMYIDKEFDEINIIKVFESKDTTKKKDDTPPPKLAFDFPSIQIRNMRYNFSDSAVSDLAKLHPTIGKFNFQNLRFKNLNLSAGIKIDDDRNVFFNCYELSAVEQNAQLVLDHFSMQFQSVTEKINNQWVNFVRFYDARFIMGKTQLNFDLFMKGQTIDLLFRTNINRPFELNVKNSNIDFATLNNISPVSVPLAGLVKLDGRIEGDYKKLKSRNLRFEYGNGTKVYANLRINDYTHPDKMYMQIACQQSEVNVFDIEDFIPGVKLPQEVKNIGSAKIDGRFAGFLNDFVADATFDTPLGKIISDINLKIGKQAGDLVYEGNLKTMNFNLDKLLNIKVSDNLNFQANVEGASTNFNQATGKYTFVMNPSNIMGHQLDSVAGIVNLDQKVIRGKIKLADPQGNFDGELTLNLQNKLPQYNFIGNFDNFDIKSYGFTELPVRLSSLFQVQMEGDSLDNLNGKAQFYQLHFNDYQKKKYLDIENLNIATANNSSVHKEIVVDGSAFYLKALGKWKYYQIPIIGEQLAKGVINFISFDTLAQKKLYATKKIENATISLQYIAKDVNPIFEFFEAPIAMTPKTELVADFDFDSQNEFADISLKTDSIYIPYIRSKDLALKLKFRSPANNDSFSVASTLTSSSFEIARAVTLTHLEFEPRIENRKIDYKITTGRDTLSNYIHIEGLAKIEKEALRTNIYPNQSKIVIEDSIWTFAENNEIYFKDKTLIAQNLKVKSNDHLLEVESDVRPGISDLLKAKLSNVNLSIINRLVDIGFNLEGNIGMNVEVLRLFGDPIIKVDGGIQKIAINKYPMGDLTTKTDWEDEKNKLNTTVSWVREQDSIVKLTGYYDLKQIKTPLHFNLNANRFPVDLFQDYLKDGVYDLQGAIDLNNVKVRGSFKNLDLEGIAHIEAKLGLTFLKQKFYLNEGVKIEKNSFSFNRMRIFNVDAEKSKPMPFQYADAIGALTHDNFNNIKFRVELSNMRRFQLMKTTKYDNSVFYGTAIAGNGKLLIHGTLNNIKIESQGLEPEKGTLVNIPVTTYEKQQRLSYVTFIQKDTLANIADAKPAEELGIEMDMNIEMNPNAEVNIIFDEKVGDKIRAKGNGTIALTMNKDSEFNMIGRYEIAQGNYLFTYANLINKSFEITPGSYLRWTGDPFNALLDLNAAYEVSNANLKAWDTTISSARVKVNMKMLGALQNPDLKFALEVPGIAQSQSYGIATTLRQIETDPQELNRQVFSLIALSSVAPLGRFFGQDAAQSGVASNLTEFLTNQLNNLISQTVNQNIGVSVGYTNNQLQVNIKARLFNDRVSIERNGAITSGVNSDISLGNISVQVRLLPGGNTEIRTTGLLAAEVFNRESNASQSINSTTRGVGVFYRKDFEVLKSQKKSKKKKKKKK